MKTLMFIIIKNILFKYNYIILKNKKNNEKTKIKIKKNRKRLFLINNH